MIAQAGALTAVQPVAPIAAATKSYTVGVDTNLYATADAKRKAVRALRADTQPNPMGNKAGLFVEVSDNYGTNGWVSVEDLR